MVRRTQLTDLLVDRYITLLPSRSDRERENLAQMLYRDQNLLATVDKIIKVAESGRAGSWGSFLGFREESKVIAVSGCDGIV